LSGALLYVFSRQKETRLLRFVLSVILIQSIPTLILVLINFVLRLQLVFSGYYWIFWLLNILKFAALIYICWKSLKALSGAKILQESYYHDEYGTLIYNPTESPRWQRFAHLITDTVICIAIFIPLLLSVLESALRGIDERGPAYLIIFVLLLIARTIYYIFFEILLGATPAKFLTESRVVRNDAQPLSNGQIVKRTFCRYIPFEPFSFFGSARWHDNFSDTLVIKEQRTGVKASTYLLVIPAFAAVGFLSYFIAEKIKYHQYRVEQEAAYNATRDELKMEFSKLSASHIIGLEEVPDNYAYDKTILKITGINGNDVHVSIMKISNGNNLSLPAIDTFYKTNINTFETAIIHKADISKAILPDYDTWIEKDKHGVDLLHNGKKYIIASIHRLYVPDIRNASFLSYTNDAISMSFINQGWPASIVSVENIEGNIKWDDPLPIDAPSAVNGSRPEIMLHGLNYKPGQAYQFKIVTEADPEYARQVYLVEGKDEERTIKRLE